ncbi:hypothetical protein BH09ACT5_BH09ACT5_01400 [soil metagenome]
MSRRARALALALALTAVPSVLRFFAAAEKKGHAPSTCMA